jgi:hypothetical protein
MAGIVITTQPVSSTVVKNRTNTLSVLATATAGTLNYNWYEDAATDVLLQSGTSNTFVPLPLTTSKSYYVKVWTSDAPTVFVTSNTVIITVIDPPVITTEPASVNVRTGESATLNVVVASTPNLTPYSYQWYIGASGIIDNPVVGATSSSYVVLNVKESLTFWVRVSTGADYVNSNSARVTVTEPLFNDDEAIRQQKNDALGGSFGSQNMDGILSAFPLESITVLSQAQSLADCAKNIPNRLMEMATKFATEALESALKDATGVTFEDLQRLKDQYDKVQKIVEKIQNFNPKEITLQQALAGLQKLTGVDLIQQTNKVLNDFAAVSGISGIVEQALNSDFCKVSNYSFDGKPVPAVTNIPMGVPPSSVEGVTVPVGIAEYDSTPKDEYDAFTFQLKENTEADSEKLASYSGVDKENYLSSISYLHTIALAYHDKISKTVDNSKDVQYQSEFNTAITNTSAQHPSWSDDILTNFINRGRIISDIINRNAQVIRNFYAPSGSGEWLPWYMSAYGHVKADDGSTLDSTTADDISSGKIKEEWQYLGTRNNKLVKGTSVASNYWKFGTVLEIRFADTKAPVGSGRVRVDDSGGMSKNVIDYFCAGDLALKQQITRGSKNQGGKTKPSYTTPIEIKLVSGGPK